jgi:hypothetical protein
MMSPSPHNQRFGGSVEMANVLEDRTGAPVQLQREIRHQHATVGTIDRISQFQEAPCRLR